MWPTHGAGSFCSAPPGAERTSTIAHELATNPLLRRPTKTPSWRSFSARWAAIPPYFRRLGEINRVGPPLLEGDPTLRAAERRGGAPRLADGAVLIDVTPGGPLRRRPCAWGDLDPVAAGVRHLAGLARACRPTADHRVRDPDQDSADIAWQAAKIGYDNIVGELDGGMAAWTAAGPRHGTHPAGPGRRLDGRRVLDIRQRTEYLTGHLPGAMHVELGDIAERAAEACPTSRRW